MREWARDLGWKLGAIGLAYLLWLAVIDEPQAIRQLEVPVRFEHIDASLALVHDRPYTVVVRVQAPDPIAKELAPPDVEAVVDLTGRAAGTHLVRLLPDTSALMVRRVGARVIEVFPPALEVALEPRLTAQVTVKPTTNGTPAEGWVVMDVRVEPGRVTIGGPQSAVKKTSEARTREVSVEGKRASFAQVVPVEVSVPDVVIVGEAKARVSVVLAESLGDKAFADVPLAALRAPYETRVSPKHARVVLRGPERLLRDTVRDDLVAWVDVQGLKPRSEEYHLPVQVTFARDVLREKLKVVLVEPATAAARVTGRKTAPPPPGPDRSLARSGS